jgi:RNA polymerase-binding protein DksA
MRLPELENFRRILSKLLNTSEQPLRKRDEIAIEAAPDELDRVQNAAARELAIHQIESDALRLQNLKSALDRIRDGTYGRCLRCGTEIGKKRLAAIPWAGHCVACQSIIDEEQKEPGARELAAQV